MSARDGLTRATDGARAQVRAAREALEVSRTARGGGPAKDVRQAENQLHALRGAVADDLWVLRERVGGLDDDARRTATLATVAGLGTLAAVVGSGLAVRGRVRRALAQRGVREQARALASALAREAADAVVSGTGARADVGARRGRGGLLALVAVGVAVAGATVLQQRRTAPIDPDDLWLPERSPDGA